MYPINSMSTRRFLDVFSEEQKEKQRFCFILGSGASYTSGIRTGVVLMEQWRADLEKLEEERGNGYIKECAEAAGYDWEACKSMFGNGRRNLQNEDYFTLYDIRFAGSPTVGYAFLEKEMANISPNVGYYYLASVLHNTNNRLVITTNFDSLTEDALFYYSGHHPLVLGDERLASYVANVDRKPVIAKIHRDLLMNPMSHMEEMKKLQEEWKTPLTTVLSQYIPIVIGYAGGDQTLMSLLASLRLKGIFWCTLGDEPPEKAKKIIADNRGYWVKIQGFDELMFQMVERMEIIPSATKMRQDTNKRYEGYIQRDQELRDKYNISQMKSIRGEDGRPNVDMIQAVTREEKRNSSGAKEYRALLSSALAMVNTDGKKAVELCTQAIEAKPREVTGYDYRSTIYHILGDYESALADATKAIKLAPDKARYYNSRAITLHMMGRGKEALADRNKVLELEPENASYYYGRAITLHSLARYEEALADRSRALELAPENAKYYNGRAITLHSLARYEEALADRSRALELAPEEADYYYGRAITLHSLTRYEEALADRNKALELETGKADYYNGRAITLQALERYEEALADRNKALELDPGKAEYYYGRSVTLHSLARYEEAVADAQKAIELKPDDARFYDGRSTSLHYLEQYTRALEDADKAVSLKPNNARLYYQRAMTLHEMKRYREELDDLKQACALDPENTEYSDRYQDIQALLAAESAEQDTSGAADPEPALP